MLDTPPKGDTMSFFGLGGAAASYSDSDDSDNSDSDDAPDDTAGPAMGPALPKVVLPTPDDAFGQVTGPPKFLMPEATRPIARNARHAPPPASKDVAYIDEPEVRGGSSSREQTRLCSLVQCGGFMLWLKVVVEGRSLCSTRALYC